jgi:pyrophosphatase PpaX
LAKTLDIWLNVYKELCRKYEVDISALTDLQIVKKSFGTWAKGLSDLGIKDSENAYKKAVEMVDERVRTVELYPHVKETLDSLKAAGKKIALHTSSSKNLLYPALKHRDLEKYFDVILTKDEVVNGKPDPEVILKEIDILKANKDACLLIGDTNQDIMAGKSAGVDTVMYYPAENEKFYQEETVHREEPEYFIGDLLELGKIVD